MASRILEKEVKKIDGCDVPRCIYTESRDQEVQPNY